VSLPHQTPPVPAGRSVVDLIADEHRALLALCTEMTDASVDPARRRALGQVVTAGLSRHLSAEEQYVYPAVGAAVPDGDSLAAREVAEDHAILVTLAQLSAVAADDEEFDRLASAVSVQLRRHADASDGDLLPLLRQMATPQELVRLGNRVETATEAAPTRPHPGTPATPPWNKIVDPTVGVLDKVRDAMSRRVTYPQDL
jgi:hypothetical protein